MGGRPPEVNSARTSFIEVIDQANRLYAVIKPFCDMSIKSISHKQIHPKQANRFLGLAFLSVLAGWEEFVEVSFIRYLAGSKTRNGYAPKMRIGGCESIGHAYEILSGQLNFDPTRKYTNWTSFQSVIDKAKLFFVNGEPYSLVTSQEIEIINNANKVRNRVAHGSQKCKAEFRNVALTMLNRRVLHQGFDVGMLLLSSPTTQFSTSTQVDFFMAYIEFFEGLRDRLVPI
jgi:hypothetical protein